MMPNEARRLAAMLEASHDEGVGSFASRHDYVSRTRQLFESFGAPLAGMSDAPFADLLRTMASFPTYSLGNQSLIALQAPGSCALADASDWAALGRRLVNRARAVHIRAPVGGRAAGGECIRGYDRPTLAVAQAIAGMLGLREVSDGRHVFDAQAIRENALWGRSQSWRGVESVCLTDAADHIAVKLITTDGRVLERRARTQIGLVKTLMQAGATPNDETIAGFLERLQGAQDAQFAPRIRSFLQRFKLVLVYDVSETDGPEMPEPTALDHAVALKNLIAYLKNQRVDVVVSERKSGMQEISDPVTVWVDANDEIHAQLGYLLASAADIMGNRRALAQNRDLLNVERESINFVLDAHFGWPGPPPELGHGLAPNVEPHAAAEVVKARLTTIREVATGIILAACPGYENPLLKALKEARTPAPAAQSTPSPERRAETPKPAVARKQETPKATQKKAKPADTENLAGRMVDRAEDFNPFSGDRVDSAAEEFNPFAPAAIP